MILGYVSRWLTQAQLWVYWQYWDIVPASYGPLWHVDIQGHVKLNLWKHFSHLKLAKMWAKLSESCYTTWNTSDFLRPEFHFWPLEVSAGLHMSSHANRYLSIAVFFNVFTLSIQIKMYHHWFLLRAMVSCFHHIIISMHLPETDRSEVLYA